ncbi:related to Tyrosine-protein phosphatase-like protein OCA2 [Saccharomycodes ludwigii]|uniref:Related to Tyrosine-protein phosphatase-like protein OCA2 n=1 Tax=Saccharomycodes ludwigii TaxID=36035 RepID=A0A376B5V6_9ASCO|nr:hypothetical protein SCDLUD_002792 [Saccharomycodes ludwigii]KAH3901301.1 hypothetical protein SCDLUD_002792 [Saccharomycodes ludwigii]SSD60086.1 related to Tyrosine-protein phosphatase-like protein OCA2 [Saccharomycodes ludwigii]
MYIPPLNFAPIINSSNDLIYRSGFPMPLNYPFISETLHLKTIIYIGEKTETDLPIEYKNFIKREKIQFYYIPMETTMDPNAQQNMENMLKLILDKRNYPILMHSNKGKHRIGVAAGIIRKILQGWCISGIYQEYSIFTGNLKGEVDLEFITGFMPTNVKVDKRYLPEFVKL